MMLMANVLRRWWRLRRRMQAQKKDYRQFMSNPAACTASPWIRAMINSPAWNDVSDLPHGRRRIMLSQAHRTSGRAFILDMLDLERIIRFRGHRWSWRGVFGAWSDDVLIASYPAEYDRLSRDLRAACPEGD